MVRFSARQMLFHPAARAILLRGGLVAGHMAVLVVLAFVLGLDVFGALIVLWGMALVAAGVLGFGAPLVLLARLADGRGMHPFGVLALCVLMPVLAAAAVYPLLHLVWPGVPWAAVLATALAVHLATCLGSVARALGSLHLSMALRDGAPVLALGLAGIVGADAAVTLWLAAGLLGLFCAFVAWACWRHPQRRQIIGQGRHFDMLHPSLWASAVLGMVLAQVDIIIGGQMLTPEQIGVYALVRRLANLVVLPMSVATWVSAGPISAAHAARDPVALRQASDAGAAVALWPGIALAVAILPVAWWVPGLDGAVLLVLLAGALLQLIFAQGITVASLTGHGDLVAGARLAGVLGYLVFALVATPLDPVGNALAYALGTSLCSALLWLRLWRGTGVNTLGVQWRGRAWRMP